MQTDLIPNRANPLFDAPGLSGSEDADRRAIEAHAQYQQAAARMRGERTTQIDLSDLPLLSDLPPLISSCRQLASLNLAGTSVSQLEALASLPRLERLVLWGTDVQDLSPLRQVKSLRWLNVGRTAVRSIEALAELPQLEVLDLSHTGVTDLEPLARAIRMRELILRGLPITSIQPLERMRDLQFLDLAGTAIADLSPAEAIKGLLWLNTAAF